jgi:hypothetical protein
MLSYCVHGIYEYKFIVVWGFEGLEFTIFGKPFGVEKLILFI